MHKYPNRVFFKHKDSPKHKVAEKKNNQNSSNDSLRPEKNKKQRQDKQDWTPQWAVWENFADLVDEDILKYLVQCSSRSSYVSCTEFLSCLRDYLETKMKNRLLLLKILVFWPLSPLKFWIVQNYLFLLDILI